VLCHLLRLGFERNGVRETQHAATREGVLMVRRVVRFQARFTACAAILVSVASVFAAVSAPAAQAAAKPVSVPGKSLAAASSVDGPFFLYNEFNKECLDGREGTGNVTEQPCGADSTHEDWAEPTTIISPASDASPMLGRH
jgi:hypothetical protein